ncbi:MAG: ferritin-like domain-containing protein [Nannocystaceae bacterium]
MASLSACASSTSDCEDRPPNPFDESGEITRAAHDDALATYEEHLEVGGEIPLCTWMCEQLLLPTDSSVSTMRSCVYSIVEEDGMTTDPSTIVATIACEGEYYATCVGRRPLGHVEPAGDATLAGYLAQAAQLEAASVLAFHQLADRLTAWGAPVELVDRCRRAAGEEARHAERMAALAEAGGGAVPEPRTVPVREDMLSHAVHNAVEGCVGESWGALLGALSAARAEEPLRAAYAAIAPDEADHGQLAWEVHTWLMSQLDERERARVRAALRAALDRLPRVARDQAARLPGALGLPTSDELAALAEQFAAGLRAAA